MTYLIAIILSLVVCVQMVAIELIHGSIRHLQQGREPKAGVSLVPMIPFFQLLALGFAWLIEHYFPRHALLTLTGSIPGFFCAVAGKLYEVKSRDGSVDESQQA